MLILHILSVYSLATHTPRSGGMRRTGKGADAVDNYNGENYSDAGSSFETELEGMTRKDDLAKTGAELGDGKSVTMSSTGKPAFGTGKKPSANKSAAEAASGALLKQGKELIAEGLKKIEKSNASGPAGAAENAAAGHPKGKGGRRIIEKSSKIEISMPAHVLTGRRAVPAAGSADKTDHPSVAQPAALSSASPLPVEGPMKKLTDLLFKSSILTKNEIITDKESATLIENNIKIKSIMSQLQKIYDVNTSVLKKFLGGQESQGIPYETNEKPKDVMKYQVIEVTEKNK